MKRIIFLLLFLPLVGCGQVLKTDAQLKLEADSIKNETIKGANSAKRIGRMIENLNASKPNKLKPFTLTNVGSSGAATLTDSTLNIPTYTFSSPFPANSQGKLINDGSGSLSWVPDVVATKIINIGDWNMHSTSGGSASKSVTHGISDYTKIRSVSVMIIDDGSSSLAPLIRYNGSTFATATMAGFISNVSSTIIDLIATTGGPFDSTTYDSTGFNRGYILITYIP